MLYATYKWYFTMDVPRYFKNYDFWGTFAQIYINLVQHMIWICNKCTPIFQKACFLRYIRQFTLLIARILLLNITKTGECHITARSCLVIYYDLNVKSLNTNHMYCNLITLSYYNYYFDNFSWMLAAACFPAPIARITVAAPVTASPPA